MNLFSKPRPRPTAVVLALIIVLGGIPFVVGDHANELLTPWRDAPETDVDLLDAALGTASDALAPRVPLDEPQAPATFFHDKFGDDRIGGWGPWQENDVWSVDPSAAGHQVQTTTPSVPRSCGVDNAQACGPTTAQARDVEQGYLFGDSDGYPASEDQHLQQTLVSPVISLRSLPVDAPDERSEVPGFSDNTAGIGSEGEIDLATSAALAPGAPGQGPADPERILLYMDHRYHFAHERSSQVQPNSKDCQVIVQSCHPPVTQIPGQFQNVTPAEEDPKKSQVTYNQSTMKEIHKFDWATVLLVPEGAPLSTAQRLNPLLGTYTTYQGNSAGTNPPNQGPGFSGAQLNFTEEAFDLTAWAGQDVRLVFQTNTLRYGSQEEHFTNSLRFNQTEIAKDDPFYGWALSNVRVEGPAHLHNVRLDRVVYPFPADPGVQEGTTRAGDYVAPSGTKPFEVLVLNRGRMTEDATLAVEARDAAGVVVGSCEVPVERLRPGGARRVFLREDDGGCVDARGDQTFDVDFKLRLRNQTRADLYDADNDLSIKVTGQGPDIRLLENPSVAPPLVARGEPVTLKVPLANLGASDASVDLAVRVDYWDPAATGFNETGVQHNSSLVDIAPEQTVDVPGRGHVDAKWDITLRQAGLYRFTVNATAGGVEVFEEASVVAGAEKVQEFAYSRDGFGGQEPDSNTGNILASEWSAESMLNQALPKDYASAWELDTRQKLVDGLTTSQSAAYSALRGDFQVGEGDESVPVQDLEVTFLHYAQDIRCQAGWTWCDIPWPSQRSGVTDPGTSQPQAPSNQLAVRLVEGVPTADFATCISSPIPGVSGSVCPATSTSQTLPRAVPVQHVGGSHYRNAFYNGQWIEETHTVPITALLGSQTVSGVPTPTSVPAGRLADAALEFQMLDASRCLTSGQDKSTACPLWRIAEAHVRGLPADGGDAVDLLHWSGADDEPDDDAQGTWYSYAYRTDLYAPSAPRDCTVQEFRKEHWRSYNEHHPWEDSHENHEQGYREDDHGTIDGILVPVLRSLPSPANSQWIRGYYQDSAGSLCVGGSGIASAFVPTHAALWPNCQEALPDAGDAVGAWEENQLRCGVWRQEDSSATPPTESWDMQEGSWTNAKKDGGVYKYDEVEGGRVDLLTSPVLRVPETGSPTVAFDHRFKLHPYANVVAESRSPSYGDTGMLMVRLFDETGVDPVTPFLPVYQEGGRFTQDDCKHYYGPQQQSWAATTWGSGSFQGAGTPLKFKNPLDHPDSGDCGGLQLRQAVGEAFSLDSLPVLDYRGPSATLASPAVTVGLRDGVPNCNDSNQDTNSNGNVITANNCQFGHGYANRNAQQCDGAQDPVRISGSNLLPTQSQTHTFQLDDCQAQITANMVFTGGSVDNDWWIFPPGADITNNGNAAANQANAGLRTENPLVVGSPRITQPLMNGTWTIKVTNFAGAAASYDINVQFAPVQPFPTERGDVGAAFQRLDLRQCAADGTPLRAFAPVPSDAKPCAAQFAFRLEVPEPTGAIQTMKGTSRGVPGFGGEGWFIDGFRIALDDLTDFDLELLDNIKITTDTGYDWKNLGLGPDTDVTATLSVQNNGFFTVTEAVAHVTIFDVAGNQVGRHEVETGTDFKLDGRRENTAPDTEDMELSFRLPSDDGQYRMLFGVDLPGELVPGVPRPERDPGNDCRLLGITGVALSTLRVGRNASGCVLPDAAAQEWWVELESNPSLDLTLRVTPEAGRTGKEFQRTVDVTVENTGNVVVHDAKLNLLAQHAEPNPNLRGDIQLYIWTVEESPQPKQQASWSNLILRDETTSDPVPPRTRLTLMEPGTWFVNAFLQPGDDADWEAVSQVQLKGLETIFSDTFGRGGVVRGPVGMVDPSAEMVAGNASWNKLTGKAPDAEGELRDVPLWQFGDAETGRYPDGANASLEFPRFDLSGAKLASVAISHNHFLEDAYDGARLEASLDSGDTWLPVKPRDPQGSGRADYPGTVAAENPLNLRNDPTEAAPAFTGASLNRRDSVEGWVIDEFDLSQLPGFTTPIQLEQFSQEGFDNDDEFRISRDDSEDRKNSPLSSVPSWGGCDDVRDCWQRENLRWMDPPPRAGTEVWWSGSAGDLRRDHLLGSSGGGGYKAPGTQLDLTFDASAVKDAENVQLTYAYWKDSAGRLTVQADGGAKLHHLGRTGWNEASVDIDVDDWEEFQVRFLYEDEICWWQPMGSSFKRGCDKIVNHNNRGAAIADVRLEVYMIDNTGEKIIGAQVPVMSEEGTLEDIVTSETTSLFGRQNGEDDAIQSLNQTTFCSAFAELCEDENPLFGWKLADEKDRRDTSPREAWGVAEVLNRRNELGDVWRFGNPVPGADDGETTYPGNARERLVTPLVDLRGVAGDSAAFTASWHYDLASGTTGRVRVQALEPTANGTEKFGEWELLDPNTISGSSAAAGCDGDPAWCRVEFDISDYIGKEVRFAFEVATPRFVNTPARDLSWAWHIDGIGITAESLVGAPVHLRLRAASDASISEGHWMVENVQVVGLTYSTNVAVLPDEPIPQSRELAPGETFALRGFVRNLGDEQNDLCLHLSVEGDDDPTIRFLDHDGGAVSSPDCPDGFGPFGLGDAGQTKVNGDPVDRVPYHIEVEVPDSATEANTYRFTLDLRNGDGVLVDDRRGDHVRLFEVVVDTDPTYEGVASVHPPTVARGQTTAFVLDLNNTGSITLAGTAKVVATRLDGNQPDYTLADGIDVATLLPGAVGTVEEILDPEDLPDGFYRITAEVDLAAGTDRVEEKFYTHLMVGRLPIYHSENFSADPFANGWGRDPAGCAATDGDCWRHSTVFRGQGGGSLFLGDDQPGPGYSAAQASADTPSVDLSFLASDLDKERPIVEGDSPFSPFLSARYRSTLEGDVVTVKAATGVEIADEGFLALVTKDPHSDRSGNQGLNGQLGSWRTASFPLWAEDNNVLAGGERLLDGDPATFRFDANWMGGEGDGFAVDLLTVSSYSVAVAPEKHDVTLRPGSDKTFYFLVENQGAARDTYHVSINPETSHVLRSGLVSTQVLNKTLSLEPGDTGLAAVRVQVPLLKNLPTSIQGTQIKIDIASETDPNRVAKGTIHVEEFIKDDLPDLVTELNRPGGETGPVVEGEQATFIVTVSNRGQLASRATDLVLFACPKHRDPDTQEDELTLSECRDEGLARPLRDVALPGLLPSKDQGEGDSGHAFTTTFSWVPPLGSRGDHRIVAAADPLQDITQLDRHTSVDELVLEVAPLERPDLLVTDLRVVDARGDPVTRAVAGQTLRIEGTVRNDGISTAPDVRVRIANQFNLRDEAIGDMNPGAQRTLEAQWIARPGNWVVLFEASTSAVETSLDNNAERWSLAIRSGVLEAHWEPGLLHVAAGQSADAELRVDNRRDRDGDLAVVLTADDVVVHGLPATMQIARGASAEMPVSLTASPFAEAGRHSVRVDLVEQDTGDTLASATLDLHVDAERSVRLRTEPVVTPPGTVQVRLTFSNDGNAPESLTVRLEAPDGWTATLLQPTLRLDPGGGRTVQAALEIPAGTPAGRYPVTVEAGDLVRQQVDVDVVRQPVWRSEVQAVHSLRDHVEVLVHLENAGNAPATPPVSVPGGTPYSVHPPLRVHEPGEGRAYRVIVQAEGTPSILLPGRDEPIAVDVRPERPAVEAGGLDVQSAGSILAGDRVDLRFRVLSSGDQMQERLPVRLWVDGVLMVEQRLDLAAGEDRDVDFRWQTGDKGPRVVTATVGSGHDAVARTVVVEVAPEARGFGIPGPGFPVSLAVVLIAAVVVWRRRAP